MTITGIQCPTAIFDKDNPNWQPVQEYNLMFVRQVQNYLNDLLFTRGHVFLNEAYDHLGFPRTPDGCIAGWLRDEDHNTFVDLGLFDKGSPYLHPTKIKLSFNIDGIIYTKI